MRVTYSSIIVDRVRHYEFGSQQDGQQELFINRNDLKTDRFPTCHCFLKLRDGVQEINRQDRNPIGLTRDKFLRTFTKCYKAILRRVHNSSFQVGDSKPTNGHSQACHEPTWKEPEGESKC